MLRKVKYLIEHTHYRTLFIGVVLALCTIPLFIWVLKENRRRGQIERVLKERRYPETISQLILKSPTHKFLRIVFTGNTNGYEVPPLI